MSKVGVAEKEPEILNAAQPEKLKEIRKEAWKIYANSPAPSRVPLLWRYTDPAKFEYTENGRLVENNFTIPKEVSADLKSGNIDGIVFNNAGNAVSVELSKELSDAGIVAGDLKDMVSLQPDLIDDFLGKIVGKEFGKYESLNLATWTTGIYLYIPENLTLKNPIHLLTNVPENGKYTARTLIITGSNAHATVVDEIIGGPEKAGEHSVNVVTEIYTGNGSNVRYLNAQKLNSGAKIFHTHRMKIGNDSKTMTAIAALGANVTKANYGSILTGKGGESMLEGFLLGDKRNTYDHYTIHDHYGQHTSSNMNFKTVVKDRAHSACTGRININDDAAFSEAYQENRNLILSPKCRVDSIPELEIKNDEVSCSHGATMGPPEEAQLFYLQSRGIPEKEAIQLVVEGFLEDSLKRLPDVVRSRLTNYLSQSLKEIA